MNPYEPLSQSQKSLEDRIEKLEAKLVDSKPAGFLLSSFVILLIMASGAMFFYIATRAGR